MADFTAPGTILVTCALGAAKLLSAELAALGFPPERELLLGVTTRGSLADCMGLNLRLFTAHRVLFLLRETRAESDADLYREAAAVPWEDFIPADGYVRVDASVRTKAANDSRFVALRVKDAIVDRLRERCGRRPDSGPLRTGVCVFAHWRDEALQLYLDTTGESLSRRGYRKIPHRAPLSESLAAAILLAGGWPRLAAEGKNLVLPMCGSGALAIEGALMARGQAPGLTRERFAFQALAGYDPQAFERLTAEAVAAARPDFRGRILATDLDPKAIEAARKNARTAGVLEMIEFAVCDFRDTEVPAGGGLVALNPEYGVRMGDTQALAETYAAIGDFLKRKCQGCTALVLAGDRELGKRIGLKPRRKIPLWNADIECRLLEFELYAGSRKARAGEPAPE